MCSIRLPRRNGGGGERCEPVGALAADVTFSRWRCADRSRRPFHHASHGPPPPLRQGRLGFAHSVPLRGCGFEMTCYGFEVDKDFYSFRPLAGMCSIRLPRRNRSQFPSPCGDVVLKSLPREVLRRVAQSAVLRRGCVSPPFSCGNTFYKQLYPARLYVRRGSPLQYSTEPPAVQAVCCAWTRLTAASARRAALSQDNASSRARRYPRGR